jgi:hypothetical protein
LKKQTNKQTNKLTNKQTNEFNVWCSTLVKEFPWDQAGLERPSGQGGALMRAKGHKFELRRGGAVNQLIVLSCC